MKETVESKADVPEDMRAKFKADADKFNTAYKTILDSGCISAGIVKLRRTSSIAPRKVTFRSSGSCAAARCIARATSAFTTTGL